VPPVPIARVHLHGDEPHAASSRRSIESVASANIAIADDAPDNREGFDAYDDAFLQVVLPSGALWGDGTLDLVLDLFANHAIGVVRAVDDNGAVVDVIRTRALRRAVQQCPEDDPIEAASRLFGVWWVDIGALDITSCISGPDDELPEVPQRHRVGVKIFDGLDALLRRAAR
jgi:hypothetical protein